MSLSNLAIHMSNKCLYFNTCFGIKDEDLLCSNYDQKEEKEMAMLSATNSRLFNGTSTITDKCNGSFNFHRTYTNIASTYISIFNRRFFF